jgi:cell division protein FtsI (penicillin-binding protein 3)
VAGALALVFVVIVGRATQVALVHEAGAATSKPAAIAAEAMPRADIVDRRGEILATSLPAWNLSANPRAIWNATDVAAGVHSVFPDIDAAELARKLADKDRAFVPIRMRITPPQRKAMLKLGLEGLAFAEETRRVYPGGKLAGHLLGFTNRDGKGAEGVEYAFDEQLASGKGPLRLTLDARVQFALEDEIEKAQADFEMKGAAGVVLDARDGAVRAIASWPQVDPNKPNERAENAKKNRALGEVYELGSIYKPLTVASALEAGVLGLNDTFDTTQSIRIGARLFKDRHPIPNPRAATAADIIAWSSNIGAIEIGERVGPRRQKDFLEKVGLLTRPEYEGPPSGAPILPAEWTPMTSATVAYGHGIAVSPLAFAFAYTPFATGGEYVKPSFVEPVDPAQSQRRRVMAAPTAQILVEMLRKTVLEGTGKLADAPGYEVAGKTGTAEKIDENGVYQDDHNVTSFAAVFPASRPQFVVLIVLDDALPRTGDVRTASVTAAAIAGRLIARAGPLLDVAPVMNAPVVDAKRNDHRPAVQPVRESAPL